MIGIRGYALPSGEPAVLYADGDSWVSDPLPGAEIVAEGWIIPGLVDMHTHPGAKRPGDPLSGELLREDLQRHVRAGVTAIRAPGLAGEPPDWFGTDPDLHGRVSEEVRALAEAGLPPAAALGAASWTARSYLGLGGLEEGAPADAVIYDRDPRTDLAALDAPSRVILRGRLIR